MKPLPLDKAFTLIERGPVVLVTTHDGHSQNIMTISWTMVLDFAASFAITTGPWNYSYAALLKSKNCVISIPAIDQIDTVVGIGTCSGQQVDKFAKFNLTAVKAKHVSAPLIKECLANIECKVVEVIERYNIVVLEGGAAYYNDARQEKRMIHPVGDGTFIADGRKFDRKIMMRSKLPDGV
ncbi:flavin reductase family protein [Acetobacter indonesiensis]|uniref:Flavin reductase n=1 Tax=Acetobacter indonesiensis TaxID=104101 RepID=A0A6N3T5M0_9PROT|nr:flavin reductase family protein [Acetobacter indonesiensis]GAN64137.1 hypothetical protein Abin_053_106 [Acetobacter indonesiensis]GEN03725.1 flavin reductase [Acetobacter indonesiensis]